DGKILITQAQYSGSLANTHNRAFLFNPTDKSFEDLGTMIRFRQNYSAQLLPDGKVMAIGGYKSGDDYHTTSEIFDPVSKTWSTAPESSVELPNAESVLANGRIFTNTATFDIESQTWIPHNFRRRNAVIKTMNDGRVILAGGEYANDDIHSAFYHIMNTETLEVEKQGTMNQEYYNHSMVVLDDGRIMIGGGNREVHIDANPHVEIFDPATDTWTVDESQVIYNSDGCLFKQSDGKVVAIDYVFSDHFLFDPSTNTWADIKGTFPSCQSCPKTINIGGGKMLLFFRTYKSHEGVPTALNKVYIYTER
ncbi:MAG TPA: kelch repeat-containing protein, partial [Chryseosolibacter sp.]|nr:kelch repeat-containing protein [Chryseosolibacter sp.]